MKKTLIALLMILSIAGSGLAEVTRKTIQDYPGAKITELVYFSEGKEIAKEIYDDKGVIIKTIGKIPDGIVKSYHKNGNLLMEDKYKNGKPNGLSKWYYENGKLEGERNYKDGKENGLYKEYYESGKLKVESNFREGKRNGLVKLYYESGKLQFEWIYKDDQLNGLSKAYYENGKIKEEGEFKNDKKIGLKTIYNENGGLQSDVNLKGNKLNVLWKILGIIAIGLLIIYWWNKNAVWSGMKNKILAIFGIGTHILSVLSSATDLKDNSVAPTTLIVISGIALVVFIVMATIRLWKEAKNVSIILISSAIILFIMQIIQTMTSPSYGSPIIILLNVGKVIYLIAFVWTIIKLFKMKNIEDIK